MFIRVVIYEAVEALEELHHLYTGLSGILRHSGITTHVMIICDASYHVVDHV